MLAWEMIFPAGVVILGAVLAVMMWRNHNRNKRVDAVTEAATREEYDHPDRYDRTQEQFRREAERRR